MGLFSKKQTCQQAGSEIAEQFENIFYALATELGDVPDEYEEDVVILELTALAYVGCRLAIQRAGLPHDKMALVLFVVDQRAMEVTELGNSEAFLNRRGEQYHALVNDHIDEIRKGETKQFALALALKVDQFCRNAGEDDDPLVLGNVSALAPLGALANHLWGKSFWHTWKYLRDTKLK